MLLDAMASGLPVIAGDVLDAREYVGDGGWLVKPGDINHLAETMVNALSDPYNYSEVSKKAIERSKLFTWDKTAAETIAVYTKVLNNYAKCR